MKPIILTAALGLVLSGCTSIMGPTSAPTCDGLSRRPLNPSLWDWDRTAPVASVPAPPAAEPAPLVRRGATEPAGSPARAEARRSGSPARFDVAASTRSCAGESSHG